MHLKYSPGIDGLRAIAILGVVIYHFDASLLPGGFVGVDVFFVISGYLISRIIFRQIDSHSFSFRGFYVRRIRRIFPALIAMLAAVLIFGWFALLASEYQLLGKHVFSGAFFMANFRLMKEAGYFDVASHLKPLLHLWSLSIEEQFYIFWPLLAFSLARPRKTRLFLILALMIVSIASTMWFYQRNSIALFFHPLSRFWELLAGALLSCLATRPIAEDATAGQRFLPGNQLKNLLGLLGLLFIACSYAFISGDEAYPSLMASLPVVGAALCIYAEGSLADRLLSLPFFVGIGLISYPLYLWHWPVFSFIHITESGTPPRWLMSLGLLLSFLLAWITYAFIERKLRFSQTRLIVPALSLAVVLLAVCGKLVSRNQGFPQRASLDYLSQPLQQTIRDSATDNQCLAYIHSDNPPYYCRMATGNGPILAVIGDSHAHTLYPAIAELRSQKGASTILLANSGCPPFLGTTFGRSTEERLKCNRDIEEIIRLVENDRNIDRVLIATRGPIYITGKGFGPAEKKYNQPPLASARENTKLSPSDIFENGLEATAKRLHGAGKQVGYLLQVPEIGIPPIDCLRRPLELNPFADGDPANKCRQPKSIYEQRMSGYRELVSQASAKASFKVYDPTRVLCPDDTCSAIRDGQLLYADDNHLSLLGSRRALQSIAEIILP